MDGAAQKRLPFFKKLQNESLWKSKVYFFETVTSTNDILLELAEKGEEEGAIVIANTQTRGRGQFHRPWFNPPGLGLWMSLLLRLPIEIKTINSLSQLGPVALCDTFKKLGIVIPTLRIKAPNDLLAEEKKLAGVLVETRLGASSFAVVGIGLNIDQKPEDFPPELRHRATSLNQVSSKDISHEQLIAVLVDCLYHRYQELHSHPQRLHDSWHSHLHSYVTVS